MNNLIAFFPPFAYVLAFLFAISAVRHTTISGAEAQETDEQPVLSAALKTSERAPEAIPHFPNRTAAFIWRNWNLVPVEDLAATLRTREEKVLEYASCMGLPSYVAPPWERDSIYVTVLRRNWSILPFEQLLTILHLSEEQLATRLREDDFLSVKLGDKPLCPPLLFEELNEETRGALKIIADETEDIFVSEAWLKGAPRFEFLREFENAETGADTNDSTDKPESGESAFKVCYLHSYFALFGDPLLQDSSKMYPDKLLQKLSNCGVNGVWLHSLLRDLAPQSNDFPEFGDQSDIRRANLRDLVNRAKKYGIDVYLYMNEPRALPERFFDKHESEKGVAEGSFRAMCASAPKVRKWLVDSLAGLFAEVPGLGGIFTISGSENLTTCVSHGRYSECPRCSQHTDAELLVDLNAAMEEGVHRSAPEAKVIVWDWGWRGHGLATDVIEQLPREVWLQSVSEWGLPLNRGGVSTTVGEYSISAVGPGSRAVEHWSAAKRAGLKTIAKCQFNTTWEIGSIPSIPALELVARHASNLTRLGLDGVMASWSLGGFPSINLDLVNTISQNPDVPVEQILDLIAVKYYGNEGAALARKGWKTVSTAFESFPFSAAVVYTAPNQIGPANLLRLHPTGNHATMVGIPYDDVNSWSYPYPSTIFASLMERCGTGFLEGANYLKKAAELAPNEYARDARRQGLYAEFAGSVFLSVANQTRFILLRDERIDLIKKRSESEPDSSHSSRLEKIEEEMIEIAENEITLARKALDAALEDSCIGFESTNQYWFVPNDLIEKIISCRDVVRRIQAGLCP